MKRPGAISIVFLLLAPVYTFSQVRSFEGSLDNHCIYSYEEFPSIPYLLDGDPYVENIIRHICEQSGVVQDFEVLAASINSIAAVREGEKYYLLYSRYFTDRLQSENPVMLYAILAHEIGHIVRKHQLDGRFRLSEESSADEFMGRAMYHLNEASTIDLLISAVKRETFIYDSLFSGTVREEIIRGGWNSIDGLIRSQNNLGYFESEANRTGLTLPIFQITGCPKFHDITSDYFSDCKTLGHIDRILGNALKKMEYDQRRYYAIPNGFALLTPVEQIDAAGRSLQGKERWQDYPSYNRFEGVLEYLKSIFLPNPGYFRLFAFVITDQPFINQSDEIEGSSIADWVNNGGYWLPEKIALSPFTPNHHVGVFVYEFEVKQSIKYMSERCRTKLLSVEEHLDRSGIYTSIKR